MAVSLAGSVSGFIEYQADNVCPDSLQHTEERLQSLAVGPTSQRDHNHAVHDRRHLERFRETEEWRCVDDDKIIIFFGFLEYVGQTGAHQVSHIGRIGTGT